MPRERLCPRLALVGLGHFCIGWDARVLYDWWRVKGAGMRDMLTDAPAAARSKQAAVTY